MVPVIIFHSVLNVVIMLSTLRQCSKVEKTQVGTQGYRSLVTGKKQSKIFSHMN